jgi:glycosyltransferase involved in cell wall biosynthesis
MLLKLDVTPGKIFRIHLGVNVDRFQPRSGPRRPGPTRAMLVGSVSRRKGVHHLLRALNQISLDDAELVIVGSTHASQANEVLRL